MILSKEVLYMRFRRVFFFEVTVVKGGEEGVGGVGIIDVSSE